MGTVTTSEYGVVPIEYLRFYTAYEFSKRKFANKYGEQLPVWMLLASGATGGVRFRSESRRVGIRLKITRFPTGWRVTHLVIRLEHSHLKHYA